MTFDLGPALEARRTEASAFARSVLAELSGRLDEGTALDAAIRARAAGVLPSRLQGAAQATAVAIEELAAVSPAVALVALGDRLGLDASSGPPRWSGCRGADPGVLREACRTEPSADVAVSAMFVGCARAAVEAALGAIRQAIAAGRSTDAVQPAVADAATAVEASRLLVWHAACLVDEANDPASTRALARLHALESLRTALAALPSAVGAEAVRVGQPLERLHRDATTLAVVLGDEAYWRDAAGDSVTSAPVRG